MLKIITNRRENNSLYEKEGVTVVVKEREKEKKRDDEVHFLVVLFNQQTFSVIEYIFFIEFVMFLDQPFVQLNASITQTVTYQE